MTTGKRESNPVGRFPCADQPGAPESTKPSASEASGLGHNGPLKSGADIASVIANRQVFADGEAPTAFGRPSGRGDAVLPP